MNNNRFLELLAKKKSGVITLLEKAELEKHLENDADAGISDLLDDLYTVNYNFSHVYKQETIQKVLNRLNDKIDVRKKKGNKVHSRRRWLKISAVAAVFLMGLGGFVYYFLTPTPADKFPNIVSTKKGSKSNIVLPDGTKVWINADTKVSYDENEWGRVRNVQLEGEAFFDVVKDARHPFVVHTKTMDIKVTGTAFNVRAYANERKTETTLIHGSVEVSLKRNGGGKIVLAPNEKLVVSTRYTTTDPNGNIMPDSANNDIQLLAVNTNDNDSAVKETQWTQNQLVFQQETLSDIIPVLERWYDVKIDLRESVLSNKIFSGTFENDSLEDVLESFKFSLGFKYSIQKNKVVIY